MKKFFTFVAAALFAGSMMAADLLNIDFTQGQGEWTITDVQKDTLSFVWQQTANYGMKASAYTTAAHETESWLVSPDIDLTVAESAVLTINHAMNKGNNSTLAVMATTNGSDWNEVTLSQWPAGNNWNFLEATADLSAYAGNHIQLAFKYASSTSNCPTWEIKSVVIAEGEAPEPPAEADVVITGADFAGQGTASTGSEVSVTKDGVTFACDKGYSDDAHATLRCYQGGVITITSETKQIGKLAFQFYSTYTGDLETEVVVNATEWTYTLPAQARIEKVSIFFGESDPIEPEALDTIGAAVARTRCEALPVDGTEKVAVLCYVASIKTPYSEQYGNVTVWLNDDVTSTYGDIQAYRAKCSAEDGAALAEHDRVLVVGNLSHTTYEKDGVTKDSYQIAQGAQLTRLSGQGIENIIMTENIQKVIVDGVVYIVRDNKLYNLQGAQVR